MYKSKHVIVTNECAIGAAPKPSTLAKKLMMRSRSALPGGLEDVLTPVPKQACVSLAKCANSTLASMCAVNEPDSGLCACTLSLCYVHVSRVFSPVRARSESCSVQNAREVQDVWPRYVPGRLHYRQSKSNSIETRRVLGRKVSRARCLAGRQPKTRGEWARRGGKPP